MPLLVLFNKLTFREYFASQVGTIEILGLECALYFSKFFGLTHVCGTNMAANDWQKDCCCD